MEEWEMQHDPVAARVEPVRRPATAHPARLELQVWLELPLARSDYPIRRRASISLALGRSGGLADREATKQRAPSHAVDAAIPGIVVAFLGALAIGLLGRGLGVMLWSLPW
jgi:hypothetical protein